MIKAVLFDAGGTLLKPHPSVGAVYAEIAARHSVKTDPAQLEERFRIAWKKQKRKQEPMDRTWWRHVVDHVFEPYSFHDADAFFSDLYNAFTEPSRWRVYPDVFPSLTALKERGITAAIASNWDERLPKLLRELSLAPHFDFQFISSFIGHTKPEAAFFNHALKMMGLEADEVLHVGDDPIDDITGALGVGIKGVLLDRRGDKAAGEVINNLTQLVGLV